MPTINQLYQSRNKSDQRNRPRSRAVRPPKFLQRSIDKRQWWSTGVTSTQNTIVTPDANFGTRLLSIPTTLTSSRKLSTRFASRSNLRAGSPASQDRNPPISLWNVASHGTGISYLSGTTEQDEGPLSPGWPFTRASSTLPGRSRTASRALLTENSRYSATASGNREAVTIAYVEVDDIQATQGPRI